MTKIIQPTGLIKPFNLDPQDYAAMFEEDPPAFLTVLISLRAAKGRDGGPDVFAEQREVISRVTALPDAQPDTCNLNVKMNFCPDLAIDTTGLTVPGYRARDKIPPMETCIQIGFVGSGWQLPGRAPRWSMGVLDRCVEQTGSIEPAAHSPLVVARERADEYQAIVGDLYATRQAVWCRKLHDFRNKLGVMLRAELLGRNPLAEYNRFVKAGGKYYLEYPTLCP